MASTSRYCRFASFHIATTNKSAAQAARTFRRCSRTFPRAQSSSPTYVASSHVLQQRRCHSRHSRRPAAASGDDDVLYPTSNVVANGEDRSKGIAKGEGGARGRDDAGGSMGVAFKPRSKKKGGKRRNNTSDEYDSLLLEDASLLHPGSAAGLPEENDGEPKQRSRTPSEVETSSVNAGETSSVNARGDTSWWTNRDERKETNTPPTPPPTERHLLATRKKKRSGDANLGAVGLARGDPTTPSPQAQTHMIKGGLPCDPAPPPFRLAMFGEESLYTLVLLRHGESEWNHRNLYTGWCDVNLTERGRDEAHDAGRLLRENGIEVDHAFTSVLRRASFTTNMALNTSRQHWVPVTKTWRLNERHYGALQGYEKDTAYRELGIDQELVMEMRRSYDTRPPIMEDDHPHWHGNDRRYKELSREQLERTRGESLKDAAARILPFYKSVILPSLKAGNKCLVVSHANTIRTLVKHIDNITDEDIKSMSIPTGIPLLYRLDRNFRPVDPKIELEINYLVEPKGYTWATSHRYGFHGVYLGDLERLKEIQRKRDITNRDWQRIILRNLAKALVGETSIGVQGAASYGVMETRQLWWQIHSKMASKAEFGNMMILSRMKAQLEDLLFGRRQRYLTMMAFESMLNKIHLDTEGKVVEPFEELGTQVDKEERARKEYELLSMELEEEALIR